MGTESCSEGSELLFYGDLGHEMSDLKASSRDLSEIG